jgi:hypothetical protein
MKYKSTHIIALVSMIIIFIIFAIFMYWWVYPFKTSTQIQPYVVVNKEVKQGELLFYVMDYCKYTKVVPTVERQFIDGIIYNVPSSNAQIKYGCGKITNSIKVPSTLPAGIYYVHATVTYQINPIRTIVEEYKTEKFEVIKK